MRTNHGGVGKNEFSLGFNGRQRGKLNVSEKISNFTHKEKNQPSWIEGNCVVGSRSNQI